MSPELARTHGELSIAFAGRTCVFLVNASAGIGARLIFEIEGFGGLRRSHERTAAYNAAAIRPLHSLRAAIKTNISG
jgi:hypothetical protein